MNEYLQRLDDLQASLGRCTRQGVRGQQVGWRNLQERLRRVRPRVLLELKREELELARQRLEEKSRRKLQDLSTRLAVSNAKLKLLGPEQVLARGYSITMDAASGAVIRSAAEVKAGQRLRTKLKNGEIGSRVEGE